jgi:phosphoribosylanthranilate isomerase
MDASSRPRIKICCISSVAEAHLAIRAGASALGLVSAMPSGPGIIPEPLIAQIIAAIPPGVDSFLLTSLQSASEVIDQQRRLRPTTLQLVDDLTEGDYDQLRAALPGVALVQVIHVAGEASLDAALKVAPHVDAVLLDSGNQQLAVKELGGTGRRHDWRISRRIREALDVPIFLAGGLKPENVREAIDAVGPYGLDVCSGVRTAGHLDPAKLAAFLAAARAPS